MHAILYPPDHKKAGQKKAEKDKTDAERRSQEYQERFRIGREQALARDAIKPIADALRTLKDKAF